MKKFLTIIVLSLLAIPASFADYPQSGIDFDLSTVTITLDTSGVTPPAVGYVCTVEPTEGTPITFTDAGWNETTETFDNLTNCFNSAGSYLLDIHIVDNAGNSDDHQESFEIMPGTPTEAILNGDTPCSSTANALDQCDFTLVLRDPYGNIALNQDPNVYSPTVTGNFPTPDANTATDFLDGLMIQGNHASSAPGEDLTGTNNNEFNVKAAAPSIETVSTDGGSLSRVVERLLDFTFTGLKKINADGSVGTDPLDANLVAEDIGFTFLNPFYSKPSVLNDLEYEQAVNIGLITDTDGSGLGGGSAISLSMDMNDILGNICERDIDDNMILCGWQVPGGTIFDRTINSSAVTDSTNVTPQKYLDELDNYVIGPNSIALITEISYTLAGNAISYAAGAVGGMFDELSDPGSIIGLNTQAIDTKFIGADIEGFISINEDETVLGIEGEEILNIGLNTSKTDIYEKIVKNGWALVRNANVYEPNNNDLTKQKLVAAFNSQGSVVVIDLTNTPADNVISIGGAGPNGEKIPEGKNTLIIVNGNLKITDNLTYKNSDDSFGVIMLRTEAGSYPDVGNIFVESDVQLIDGSFFADGGFMNNNGDTVTTGNDKASPSTYQLLLKGALLSRNTLGGSLRGEGAGGNTLTDYTPWGETTDTDISRRYDLHFVRRYDSDTHNDGTHNIAGESNTAAFIIRPDNKASFSPPPGFKVQ